MIFSQNEKLLCDFSLMLRVCILIVTCVLTTSSFARPLLWQTHTDDEFLYLFDLEPFDLKHKIHVGPSAHGIATPDDASMVYVTIEKKGEPHGEVLWIDPTSKSIIYRLKVGPMPHEIDITPNGRWLYVPCGDGNYWVVDTTLRQVVKKIETGKRPHNTQVSRDGRYMFLSPLGKPGEVTVVDIAANHTVVGTISFSGSARPAALSANGKLLFHHVDGLVGFQVADTSQLKVIDTIRHSYDLGWLILYKRQGSKSLTTKGFRYCHGLGLRPDQHEIWSVCEENLAIHDALEPDYKETHLLELKGAGYWISFSLDSRFAFVSLAKLNQIAVFDTKTKKIIKYLKTGKGPKRSLVIDHN